MTPRSEIYWAAETDPVRLGEAVETRFRRYRDGLSIRSRGERIRRATLAYFGFDPDGQLGDSSDLEFGGEQGEAVIARVNHYRSLVRSMLGLATSSRPAFDATATDDSAESGVACELAEQIWDYELEVGLERHLRRADERMLVQSEAAVGVFWDPAAGEIVGAEPVYETDPHTGEVVTEEGLPVPALDDDGEQRTRPIWSGELQYEVFGPRDVARDPEHHDLHRVPWLIVRRPMHRWDLIAQYGDDHETRQRLLGAAGPNPGGSHSPRDDGASVGCESTDMVWVLELYHDRTRAVPEGRWVRVVDGHVLGDGPLPYERIPVVLRAPDEEFDRASGHTETWDLLGLSKAIDAAVSDFISILDRHGDSPVLMPEGADIDPGELTGPGVAYYKWQQGMPPSAIRWLEGPGIPSDFMKLLEWMTKTQEVLSGVNSVVRGDPEASLKSGAALALVQAMAVQHSSAFQAVAADLRREVATRIIETYRRFATTERLIEVAGDNELGTVRSFQGGDLGPVRRIRAELANPLMRTIAGKKELADDLTAKFPNEPPLTRSQYLRFLNTGRLDPMFRADRAQAENVQFENDRLVRGEPVQLRVGDHHEMHIREHNALLDGKARYELDEQEIAAIEAHILEHGQTWVMLTTSNPALLAATNQRPAPMPQPMMPPGAMGPGDPGAGPPPPQAGGPAGPSGPQPSGDGEGPPLGPPNPGAMGEPPLPGTGPQAADMPQAPINPATGQRAQLPDGAMG